MSAGRRPQVRAEPGALGAHAGQTIELLRPGGRAERSRGVGSALIEEVERVAVEAGCRRVWLITTNDNVDALRFYQRRGFRLAELHLGAVDRSRESLKPEIPEIGDHGIPLRDELELHKEL